MKEKVTELIEVKNKIQEMATDWMNQLSEKEFEEKIKRLTPEQQALVRNKLKRSNA